MQGVARGSLPRRYLTEPHRGAGNQGWDNENSDLIIAVDDIFLSGDMRRQAIPAEHLIATLLGPQNVATGR